jgi:hypothetical protein
MNTTVIAVFVVVDIIVTAAVLWIIFTRRKADGAPNLFGFDFGRFKRFTDEAHAEVGEYLRANYSGDPQQLPGVLPPLLDRLQARAQSEGLPLEREMLKTVIARSAAMHKVAKQNDVAHALDRVA